MDYAKKVLDYTIQADKVEELVNQLKSFIKKIKEELSNNQENNNSIIGDPIQVQHKDRQPKRYKSKGELSRKKRIMNEMTNTINHNSENSRSAIHDFNNQKHARHCQKYKQPDHYAPRCPNI